MIPDVVLRAECGAKPLGVCAVAERPTQDTPVYAGLDQRVGLGGEIVEASSPLAIRTSTSASRCEPVKGVYHPARSSNSQFVVLPNLVLLNVNSNRVYPDTNSDTNLVLPEDVNRQELLHRRHSRPRLVHRSSLTRCFDVADSRNVIRDIRASGDLWKCGNPSHIHVRDSGASEAWCSPTPPRWVWPCQTQFDFG